MHLSLVCDTWYIYAYLGKHKDHNVKTVRKSQPIVKTEVEAYLDRFENNVQSLQIKKS